MKISISSDEYFPLVDVLIEEVKKRGHEVLYYGPRAGQPPQDWPLVTQEAIRQITEGKADEGIVICWTGTGCTLLANKFPKIRAALCIDAETAKGARIWNHANVLGISLRLTTDGLLKEILAAWFETPFSTDAWNLSQIARVNDLELKKLPEI